MIHWGQLLLPNVLFGELEVTQLRIVDMPSVVFVRIILHHFFLIDLLLRLGPGIVLLLLFFELFGLSPQPLCLRLRLRILRVFLGFLRLFLFVVPLLGHFMFRRLLLGPLLQLVHERLVEGSVRVFKLFSLELLRVRWRAWSFFFTRRPRSRGHLDVLGAGHRDLRRRRFALGRGWRFWPRAVVRRLFLHHHHSRRGRAGARLSLRIRGIRRLGLHLRLLGGRGGGLRFLHL